jgi:hypothetical protein
MGVTGFEPQNAVSAWPRAHPVRRATERGTARECVEGKSFGYKVAIAEDAVGDVSSFLHKVALFEIAHKYADVMSLDELIGQL